MELGLLRTSSMGKEKDLFKMNRSFSFVYDGILR